VWEATFQCGHQNTVCVKRLKIHQLRTQAFDTLRNKHALGNSYLRRHTCGALPASAYLRMQQARSGSVRKACVAVWPAAASAL
jgi:hypothetical protein